MKKLTAIILVCMMTLSVFSGCNSKQGDSSSDVSMYNEDEQASSSSSAGSSAATTSSKAVSQASGNTSSTVKKADTSKKVTLKYYSIASVANMDKSVSDAVNKITQEKLNASVSYTLLPIGEYGTRMQIVMQSGEKFDLAFVSPWVTPLNYFAVANSGYLKELDSLLPVYAPDLYKSMNADIWSAAKVNGKIYASINEQIFARQAAVVIDTSMLSKYGFTEKDFTQFSDLSKIMNAMKNGGESTTYPTFHFTNVWENMYTPMKGFEEAGGGVWIPGYVKMADSSAKVFNQFKSAEFLEYAKQQRKWITDGLFDENELMGGSLVLSKQKVRIIGTYKPGAEAEVSAETNNKTQFTQIGFGDRYLTTGGVTATMVGISATSANPERALMYLNLIYTDKKLYNTLCLGIEGRDYKMNGTNSIEYLDTRKYKPNVDWAFGNSFNSYIKPYQSSDVWEQTKQINNSAKKSALYGFTFNPNPVKIEVANCYAVANEYSSMFERGLFTDVEAKVQEFNKKLDAAGADKIIAEKQKQINEFLKNK